MEPSVIERLKDKILYSAIGASSGVVGLTFLPRCQGNTCISCFGCVSIGVGIILSVIIKRFGGGKRKDNGMA